MAILLAAAAGCGAANDEDLWAALPRVEELTIGPPGLAAKPAAGEPALLYLATRRTSDQLNGLIVSLVGLPARIAADPSTPALSPVSYRLLGARSPDGVAYRVEARPRRGGDWVVVVAGEAAADGHAGHVRVELARMRALDPALTGEGQALDVGYDVAPDAMHLALRLDEAHYGYAARADGGGDFAFATAEGAIRSRWLASGAGRGEGPGVVECWDDGFARVFLATAGGGVAGDPAACPDVP